MVIVPDTISKLNHAQCIELLSTVLRMLENVEGIIRFDTNVYTAAFGEEAVMTVQKHAEIMPDTNSNDFHIQAMLNIAYDQGYQDAIDMVHRIVDSFKVVT